MNDTYLDKLLAYGLTWFGDLQFQTHPPLIRACHCRHVMAMAHPGMVIARRYNAYADGLLIPGAYTHSGIVESQEIGRRGGTVIHAVAEGVQRIDLLDFIKDADGVALIEYIDLNPIPVVNKARYLIGRPYDFKFSIVDDGKSLYCHETTATALLAGDIELAPQLRLGRGIFTYDSLIAHPKAHLVYEAKTA